MTTLVDDIRWALSHQPEYISIYESGKKIMSDFPGLPGAATLGRHTHPARVLTPEDQKLHDAIMALGDTDLVDEHHPLAALIVPHDKHVRGRLFGPRPPAQPAPIDPATGQPVPAAPRFNGAILKWIITNLPSLMTQLPALIQLFSSLFPKPA